MDWRRTKEYRVWRISVLRRDVCCVICGNLTHREAHHLNHATYFPDLRFSVDNGVTLCRQCHTQFHTNFLSSFKVKCTSKDFENFKALLEYFKGIKWEQT